MSLSTEKTQEIINKFGKSDSDTGSTAVQIALLTERLDRLNEHFKAHRQDNHSRLGLLKAVGQRKKLLRYLSEKDGEAYKTLINELGLRK